VQYSAVMQYFAVHSSTRAVPSVLHLQLLAVYSTSPMTAFGARILPLCPCGSRGSEAFLSAKSNFAVSAIIKKGDKGAQCARKGCSRSMVKHADRGREMALRNSRGMQGINMMPPRHRLEGQIYGLQ
jgi:hypothetical protein